jgi:hypothetical protein
MADFVPGLDLSEAYYRAVVRPAWGAAFSELPHSAAHIGAGSDVLGYDTSRSTDHDWGARVLLFVDEARGTEFGEGLPDEFGGHPVRGVRVLTVREFLLETLDVDPAGTIEPAEWVTFSEQSLLEVTRGRVFHDGLGTLEPVRERLSRYPEDVWRYLLAAQWRRISQDEHLAGRAAEVGDGIGSRIITARLVRDLMRLGFLFERTYAPYAKWLGKAFLELDIADRLTPVLARALDAGAWPEREEALVEAYEIAAEQQSGLRLCPPLDAAASQFFDRPFRVIFGERFSDAIRTTISDPSVLKLPAHLGGIDQVSDSTDLLSCTRYRSRLRSLYR